MADAKNPKYKKEDLLNRDEAAQYLGVRVTWLNNHAKDPEAPPITRIANKVFYYRGHLDKWIEDSIAAATSFEAHGRTPGRPKTVERLDPPRTLPASKQPPIKEEIISDDGEYVIVKRKKVQ